MKKHEKEVNDYLHRFTPDELVTMMNDAYKTDKRKYLTIYKDMFGVNADEQITKQITLKQIGKGGFNTVYITNLKGEKGNPVILRISTEPVLYPMPNADYSDIIEREEEVKFNFKVNKKYPGTVTEFTYFATNALDSTASWYAFELKEGFSMDLKNYLEQNISEQRKVKALSEAINTMDKLNRMGLYCFDVKPGNFLVDVNPRRPVGYKGPKKRAYVRITDLGADFCTEKDLKFTKHSKEAFETITRIQLLLMADSAVQPAVLLKVAKKYGLCDAGRLNNLKDTLIELSYTSGKKTGAIDWHEVYSVFDHYLGLPVVNGNLDYSSFEDNDLKAVCPTPTHKPKPKPKPRRKSPKKKKSTSKKILNPRTGRMVLRTGKIGKDILQAQQRRSSGISRSRRKRCTARGKNCLHGCLKRIIRGRKCKRKPGPRSRRHKRRSPRKPRRSSKYRLSNGNCKYGRVKTGKRKGRCRKKKKRATPL